MFKTILKLSRIRYFDMKYISGYIYSKLISDLVHGFSQQKLNTVRFVLKELSFLFIKTTFEIFNLSAVFLLQMEFPMMLLVSLQMSSLLNCPIK